MPPHSYTLSMGISLTAAADDDGRRLDRILRKALRLTPLSAIHRMLRKGAVLVNGKAAAADCRIHVGDTITVPGKAGNGEWGIGNREWGMGNGERRTQNPYSLLPTPYSLPEILFEGSGLLAVNKPAGLPVHGKGSLEDLILAYLGPKLPPSLSWRPGPLHRLDRPSSGILVFSTNLEGARLFSSLMRKRLIKKQYLCLVEGHIEKAEIWQDELLRDENRKKTSTVVNGNDGKIALTKVSPLIGNSDVTLILADIETGRTHQIRAQATSHGHPLLGDLKYGARKIHGDGFFLHAWRMELPAPLSRQIEAPLPEKFLKKNLELFGVDFPRFFV